MLAVALVTAVLNLDTSVVFMTPVALHAARARRTDEVAFSYGTVLLSNAASLLLVGSNLTNLLVFASRGHSGSDFAHHMVGPWLVSVAATTLVVLAWRWRALGRADVATTEDHVRLRVGPGTAAVAFAVVAMLLLAQPAPWVFAVGLTVEVARVARGRTPWRSVVSVANPLTLAVLFLVAVAIGWFARATSVTDSLLVHSGAVVTVVAAGLTSLVINNLPAASLFSAHHVAHPFALLLGLDLGPNCAITGALSSLLWLRIVKREEFRPSIATYSAVGSVAAVLAAAGAIALLG